ncbi:UNVERIFIED_CONTAM: hypothetical protein PYX00_008591 [Menopon gallinae]|uniref:DNA-directed RNA polymerase I subunit RPA49 n=1 Tax=Menopon gallinae TaxID=328185 RepID=A0AAW2HNT7_9NEOP
MKSELVISDIRYKTKDGVNFACVDFQNGDILDKALEELQVKLMPKRQESDRIAEIKSPDGQVYTDVPMNDLPKNLFVGLKKKNSNKIRLVEVDYVSLINSVFLKKEQTVEEDVKDIKQLNATLKRTFGTKRAVRHLDQMEALNTDGSIIEDQITETLSESVNNNSVIKVKEEEESSLENLIPHCDRDAKNLNDVYKLEYLFSGEELNSLMGAASEIIEKKNELEDVTQTSEFLSFFLKQVFKTENEEELKVRIACLLYADALIKYLKVNAKSLGKLSNTLCPYSKLICSKVIREFCVKSGSSLNRPLAMKDKAACYVIVLILRACNFEVDLEVLAKQSAFGYKKMKQLGRIVGVLPSSKTSSIHILKLPVPGPPKMVKTVRKRK